MFTFLFSTSLVSITMMGTFSCQTIRQKSITVVVNGPGGGVEGGCNFMICLLGQIMIAYRHVLQIMHNNNDNNNNNNNNIGHLYCAVPIIIILNWRITSSLTYYYPGFSRAAYSAHKHYKEWIPAGYPFLHLGRESLWTKCIHDSIQFNSIQ